MARIRSIKPEFPHSESMGRVSRDARLTFIMLWTIADDSGRLRGNSRMLASLLYPYDDDARELIDGWIDELEREGCLDRYQHDGQSYIQIRNWLSHQKIDKPTPSKLPEFADSSRILANPPEQVANPPRRKGREGRGGELSSPRAKRSGIPEGFGISDSTRTWARSLGYEPFLEAHLDYFRDYAASSGKTYADWDAAFRNCVKGDWGGVRKNFKPSERRLAL